eukprot:31497-Pelagococcus_subviridis.AAC.17
MTTVREAQPRQRALGAREERGNARVRDVRAVAGDRTQVRARRREVRDGVSRASTERRQI